MKILYEKNIDSFDTFYWDSREKVKSLLHYFVSSLENNRSETLDVRQVIRKNIEMIKRLLLDYDRVAKVPKMPYFENMRCVVLLNDREELSQIHLLRTHEEHTVLLKSLRLEVDRSNGKFSIYNYIGTYEQTMKLFAVYFYGNYNFISYRYTNVMWDLFFMSEYLFYDICIEYCFLEFWYYRMFDRMS